MNCTDNGIGLTAAEARVLLKLASDESSDRNRYGINFIVEGEVVLARATSGTGALELDGASSGQFQSSEWFVHREFIERAVKPIVGVKAVMRFGFAGASLRRVTYEENDVPTNGFDALDKDVAVPDVTFPWDKSRLKAPSKNRTIAHCSGAPGEYFALMAEVEKALGVSTSDIYPPTGPDDLWTIVVNDGGQTVGKLTFKCAKSPAATTGNGDDPGAEDDGKKRGRGKKDPRQQEIAH